MIKKIGVIVVLVAVMVLGLFLHSRLYERKCRELEPNVSKAVGVLESVVERKHTGVKFGGKGISAPSTEYKAYVSVQGESRLLSITKGEYQQYKGRENVEVDVYFYGNSYSLRKEAVLSMECFMDAYVAEVVLSALGIFTILVDCLLCCARRILFGTSI